MHGTYYSPRWDRIRSVCLMATKALLVRSYRMSFVLAKQRCKTNQFSPQAILGFLFIVLQSLSPARHAFYELFLHLHIALALMSFIALWYHLKNLLQQQVLLGTLILWGLDRASRLAILIWRNVGRKPTTATIEALPGSVARVDVAVSRAWSFRPGQHMYLYMPCLGLWTSHPFTVAWTSKSSSATPSEKRGSSDSLRALIGGSERTTVSILVKGQDGFTKKLIQKVEDSAEGHIKALALAEGPFGTHSPLTPKINLSDIDRRDSFT